MSSSMRWRSGVMAISCERAGPACTRSIWGDLVDSNGGKTQIAQPGWDARATPAKRLVQNRLWGARPRGLHHLRVLSVSRVKEGQAAW